MEENTVNSENNPPGLYFSKALFEGLIFGGTYIPKGLSTEGNLRFKIDWASLIVESKLTVFALFYFVFEGNFPSTSPWGAYIWRGLFSEFYAMFRVICVKMFETRLIRGIRTTPNPTKHAPYLVQSHA